MKRWATIAAALVVLATLDASSGTVRRRGIVTASGGGTNYAATIEHVWITGTDVAGTDARLNDGAAGSASDATALGAPTYGITPPSGSPSEYAIDFNGGSVLQTADSAFGTEGTSLSMGCWVLDEASTNILLLHKGASSHMTTDGADHAKAHSSASTITPTGTMGTVWTHWAMTINSATSTTRLYRNGVEDCGGACPTNGSGHADNGTRFTMGGDDTNNGLFGGALYECFYDDDDALSQAQICEIATTGIKGTANSTSRQTLMGGSC